MRIPEPPMSVPVVESTENTQPCTPEKIELAYESRIHKLLMESSYSELVVKRPIQEITLEQMEELSKRREKFTVSLSLFYCCRRDDLSWAFDMIA